MGIRMDKLYTLLVLAAALAACSIEADILKLPEGWHLPDRQEANETWRNHIPGRGLSLTADLDGNGKPDLAYILESEKDATLGVWVYMNGDKRSGSLIEHGTLAAAAKTTGIRGAKPGVYPTPCGKADNCAAGQPKETVLKTAGIELFVNGGERQLIYWDDAAKGFLKAPIGG